MGVYPRTSGVKNHPLWIAGPYGPTRSLARIELEARAVHGTEGARQPFFSHDSQWLAFYARVTSVGTGRELKKVAVSGGAPATVADLAGAHRRKLGNRMAGLY